MPTALKRLEELAKSFDKNHRPTNISFVEEDWVMLPCPDVDCPFVSEGKTDTLGIVSDCVSKAKSIYATDNDFRG
jgi:hypothetical protein